MNENSVSRAESGTMYPAHAGTATGRMGESPDTFRDRALCEGQKIKLSPRDEAERILKADAHHRSLQADQILMLNAIMPGISTQLDVLASGITSWMTHQGFWKPAPGQGHEANKAEKVALVMTECAEWVEAIRNNDTENEGEEIADTVIRILDYCGKYNINLGAHIQRKMLKNYTRPFKHGKAF